MKRKWTRSQAFTPSGRKTFRSALCHLLQTEFPGQFGPTVTTLFAERIEELFDHFHPPGTRLKVGQALWAAVAADDPPTRNKRIEDTHLLPVILDLVSPADVEAAISGQDRKLTRQQRIIRLCSQAYEQHAVMSYPDLSLLLHLSPSTISRAVCEHERRTGDVVPRRGTIHDMGKSVSHKAQICRKRLVDKKTTSQVAQETNHDPEEVEYYVQYCRRVKMCIDKNMSIDQIAQVTGGAKSTIQEYIELIDEFALSDQHPTDEQLPF